MKLRNKNTGEIGTYLYSNSKHYGLGYYSVMLDKNPLSIIEYDHNIDQLYQEWDILWDDCEEPKEKWFITEGGNVIGYPSEAKNEGEKIGNCFESEEEAKKAVEKLKAWKRLKDKGCRFILDDHFAVKFVGPDATKITSAEEQKSLSDDYKLLFGGEE